MSKTFHVVAIDGGAGTGKSTTASLLSKRLGLLHVDTGSHYRSITKHLLNKSIEFSRLDEYLEFEKLNLSSKVEDGRSYLAINDKVFSLEELRSAEVNQSVSQFASHSGVRKKLFNYQRDQLSVAREKGFSGLVMEGRDIGTIILPDADLKIFLIADQKVRESRRNQDGEVDQIASRDELDSSRSLAPLKESDGSLKIDSSILGVEEVYLTIAKALGIV